MIAATNTLIFKESFELCPYLRAVQKEKKRNAGIRDEDKRTDDEPTWELPEGTRLKAHLKRRIERQTKQKWVQYATEYVSEIAVAGTMEKDRMRQYLEMTREAVTEMNRKNRERRKRDAEKKRRARERVEE